MAAEDNYGENVKELGQHEERVLRQMYPEINGKPIESMSDLTIRRGVGNPSISHFLLKDIVEGREYAFFARSYSTSQKFGMNFPFKDYQSYLFLQKADVDVPRVVFLKDAPHWLFIEYIPGLTLREVIENAKEKSMKEQILEYIAENVISRIQNKATKASRSLGDMERIVIASRGIGEQTKDYLTIHLGDEEEAGYVSEKLFLPLFRDGLVGEEVVHGDLSPANIIRREGTGIEYFIDPELKRRNRFADLGSFLSYLGDFEDAWERLARIVEPNELFAKQVVRNIYQNIGFYSLRIVAKRKHRIEEAEEQERNMRIVLTRFANKPEDFGLKQKDAKRARELLTYFPERQNGNVLIGKNQNPVTNEIDSLPLNAHKP